MRGNRSATTKKVNERHLGKIKLAHAIKTVHCKERHLKGVDALSACCCCRAVTPVLVVLRCVRSLLLFADETREWLGVE